MLGLKTLRRQLFRLSARQPEVGFDREYYLENNIDVRQAKVDPYEHFMEHGWSEGRDPSKGFSVKDYLSANPDVREAGLNPLSHFVEHGLAEGRPLRPETGREDAARRLPRNFGSDADPRVARFHRAAPEQRGRLV